MCGNGRFCENARSALRECTCEHAGRSMEEIESVALPTAALTLIPLLRKAFDIHHLPIAGLGGDEFDLSIRGRMQKAQDLLLAHADARLTRNMPAALLSLDLASEEALESYRVMLLTHLRQTLEQLTVLDTAWARRIHPPGPEAITCPMPGAAARLDPGHFPTPEDDGDDKPWRGDDEPWRADDWHTS